MPTLLGAVAIVPTVTLVALHAVLAAQTQAIVHVTSIIAAVLEALMLLLLVRLLSTDARALLQRRRRRSASGSGAGSRPYSSRPCFFAASLAASVLLAALAAIASGTSLVSLADESKNNSDGIVANRTVFLVGISVALGLSLACQLVFVVVHLVLIFLSARRSVTAPAQPWPSPSAANTEDGRTGHGRPVSNHRQHGTVRQHHRFSLAGIHSSAIKSVPYSQTTSAPPGRSPSHSGSRSPPSSSGGRSARSASETLTSLRSSLSNAVRPVSSLTRLLPARDSREDHREKPLAGGEREEDGFDSWDTSGVDAHNRQTVLESYSPSSSPPSNTPHMLQQPRLLETIPASPTTSRSASPGCPLDLAPPSRAVRRSRSYSPATLSSRIPNHQQQQVPPSPSPTPSDEAHIHPLFRSDSPSPPPATTPGTVVTAAPNGGLVISDRHSIRSLSRMRSCSLPTVASPLSRHSSVEDLQPPPQLLHPSPGSTGSSLLEEVIDEEQRKMTPPIPDWVLSAGSRTSLSGYHWRKTRPGEGDEDS